MKKIKLSVAALSLALSMNAQTTPCDEVTFTRGEVFEMLATIGDILEWQNQDIEEAEYNNQEPSCGKHSEGWGSNHWLTLLEEELYAKLNIREEIDCENCDEID
tara:strand:+ start:256 stop:567 length:312 start_codon:yes stop_codon:yes gene_type:complete